MVWVFFSHLLNFVDYIFGCSKVQIKSSQDGSIRPKLVLFHNLLFTYLYLFVFVGLSDIEKRLIGNYFYRWVKIDRVCVGSGLGQLLN